MRKIVKGMPLPCSVSNLSNLASTMSPPLVSILSAKTSLLTEITVALTTLVSLLIDVTAADDSGTKSPLELFGVVC